MTKVDSSVLEVAIREAREALVAAREELGVAMAQLAGTEQTEKTMISSVLQSAFDRVAAAQAHLDTVLRSQ